MIIGLLEHLTSLSRDRKAKSIIDAAAYEPSHDQQMVSGNGSSFLTNHRLFIKFG